MKKRKIRTELHVPYGYEFEDLYDTEVPEELGADFGRGGDG